MVMFCMKKHTIKMLRHTIVHMATSGTGAQALGFKSNKAAESLAAKPGLHNSL